MDARDIPIATPCGQDFRKMTPAAGGRFCADCKKVVRDLSAMPEDEARALLAAPRTDGLCIRYLHDETGQIYFADRPAPIGALLLNRARRAAMIALTPALAACSSGGMDGDSLSASPHAMNRTPDKTQPRVVENMGGAPAPNDDYPPMQVAPPDASADGDVDGGAGSKDTTDAGPPTSPDASNI